MAKVYFRMSTGEAGAIDKPEGTDPESVRNEVAQHLSVDPKSLTMSATYLKDLLPVSAVDAEYGALYSRIVGKENSDTWPAKWVAARSVLRNDSDLVSGEARLRCLLTDEELAAAGGSETTAIVALANKIWMKNIQTSDLLFKLDGVRRRFHKKIEKHPGPLEDLQREIVDCIDSMQKLVSTTPSK